MRWWRIVVLPVILAGVMLGATPAQAHVSLQASYPGDGDTLNAPPKRGLLEFSAPLNPELTRVVVRINGTPVKIPSPDIAGRSIPLSLPDFAGRYEISYRVIAEDGHRVDGRIRFTVTGPPDKVMPSASATPPASFAPPGSRPGQPADIAAEDSQADPDQGSSPMWWLAGVGTVLVLGFLAYLLTIGRNRDKDMTSSVGTSGDTDHPGGDRPAT